MFSRNLRSTANYLLSMECFFDSLHTTAHFYLVYSLYSGKTFDSLLHCYYVMIIPLIGLTFGAILILFIALDRLLAMLFPVRHQQLNKLFYLGAIAVICLTYNLVILYIGYLNAKKNENTVVVCLIIEGKKVVNLNLMIISDSFQLSTELHRSSGQQHHHSSLSVLSSFTLLLESSFVRKVSPTLLSTNSTNLS